MARRLKDNFYNSYDKKKHTLIINYIFFYTLYFIFAYFESDFTLLKYINATWSAHADLWSMFGPDLQIKKRCIKANPHQMTVLFHIISRL